MKVNINFLKVLFLIFGGVGLFVGCLIAWPMVTSAVLFGAIGVFLLVAVSFLVYIEIYDE
jgi:hypothetical protein